MEERDLVTRCNDCKYCPIEDILTERLRERKCLENGFHKDMRLRWSIIANLCLRNNPFPDGKYHMCLMKELVLKAPFDNFMLAQFDAVIKYRYDLMKGSDLEGGGKKNSEITNNELYERWNKKASLRFREIWELGERMSDNPDDGLYQSLGEDFIYEAVVSSDRLYKDIVRVLKSLKIGHQRRKYKGLK